MNDATARLAAPHAPATTRTGARRFASRLGPRLTAAFVIVALFAAGLSALIGYRAASGHFERYLEQQAATTAGNTPGPRYGRGNRDGQQLLLDELRRSQEQAALIALIVAAFAGAALAYTISRPVLDLTRATRRYASGERGTRAAVPGGGELAELGAAFNHLADSLNAEQERERQMIADIAHEFRTPLTVLRSELEAMQDGLSPCTPESLAPLVEETELLARLVSDLRVVTLAEAGALPLQRRDTDLAALAASVIGAFHARASAAGVKLALETTPASAPVDPERLRQVLHNLLENALRHTPHGGQVTLAVSPDGQTAVLQVRDTGPGLPTDRPERIFDRFYRVDPARSRTDGGSGLGLSIVRAIVNAHGGTVHAANAPTGGAILTARLPATPPHDHPNPRS
ncbi:MAG TPA: ATP-binding protein [Deinococcales bacterium]|nr:ATP-binding protein [Deinococcales bacterium]